MRILSTSTAAGATGRLSVPDHLSRGRSHALTERPCLLTCFQTGRVRSGLIRALADGRSRLPSDGPTCLPACAVHRVAGAYRSLPGSRRASGRDASDRRLQLTCLVFKVGRFRDLRLSRTSKLARSPSSRPAHPEGCRSGPCRQCPERLPRPPHPKVRLVGSRRKCPLRRAFTRHVRRHVRCARSHHRAPDHRRDLHRGKPFWNRRSPPARGRMPAGFAGPVRATTALSRPSSTLVPVVTAACPGPGKDP